jgi:hypothetical protein
MDVKSFDISLSVAIPRLSPDNDSGIAPKTQPAKLGNNLSDMKSHIAHLAQSRMLTRAFISNSHQG